MICDPIPEGWTYTPQPIKLIAGNVPEELKWMDDASIVLEDGEEWNPHTT